MSNSFERERLRISRNKLMTTCEQVLEALEQEFYVLAEYVPKHLKTPEVCLASVKRWSHSIKYVPKEAITTRLCVEAVKQRSYLFRNITYTFKRLSDMPNNKLWFRC